MNNYEHNPDVVHTYRHSSCHSCGQLVKQVDPEEEKRRVWEIEQQKKLVKHEEEKDSLDWQLAKEDVRNAILSFRYLRPIHLWKATKWLTIRLPVHLFRATKFMVVKTPVAIWRASKFIVSRLVRLRPRHFVRAGKAIGRGLRIFGESITNRKEWLEKIEYSTNPRGMVIRILLGLTIGAIIGFKIALGVVALFSICGVATVIRTRVQNRTPKLGEALIRKAKERNQ